MPYILALDQGTTSSRAILFDKQGQIAGVAQHEFPQIFPAAGWVEHDPLDILTSQLSAAVEVLGKAGATPRDVAALGIANQRETTIVWDRETGKPVSNAIVWQDRRTAPMCSRLRKEGVEETVSPENWAVARPIFLRDEDRLDSRQRRRRARTRGEGKLAFGTVDSWLIWNLTNGERHVTDRTNASRTLLYNIVRRPLGRGAATDFRHSREHDARGCLVERNGRPRDVAAGAGRRCHCGHRRRSAVGTVRPALVRPGDAKCTYGTGCFLLQNIGDTFRLSGQRLVTTLACSTARRGEYALEGSIFIGGAVVQWLRDKMRFFSLAPDVEGIAAGVDDAGDVVFVPAFTGLGAPHWDPYATGMIIGIRRDTGIGHVARAAIESIAFQVADVLKAMDADTGIPCRELRADGGAAANNLLMQFQADLLGIPVHRPAVLESTALGAAYLAGLATGFWNSVDEIATTRGGAIFEPRADRAHMAQRYRRWRDAVERAKGWNAGAPGM